MIKFFRNIRQRLIKEGNTTNYLKYAIGEILLVMVGILLALQVNNWNENRKIKLNELKLVKQLIDDARADSIFFESRITLQKIRDTLFDNLLNLSNNVLVDSISRLEVKTDPFFFRLAYQSNLVNNNPNAYDLISSDPIKNKLREYIVAYDYVVNAIELNNRIVEEYGIPMSIKYYDQFKRFSNPLLFADIRFILNDNETVAKLDMFKTYGINYFIQCQRFLEVNQELKLWLHKYLKENQ